MVCVATHVRSLVGPSMICLSDLSIHPIQFRYNIFLLCSTRRADQDDVGEGNLCLIGSPD